MGAATGGTAVPIKNMLQFEDTIICSTEACLIEYDVSGDSFSQIATLSAVASMIVFNDVLIFVDGTGIYSWDGTSVTTLSSTIKPTAISEIVNRVVVNCSSDEDAIYFSGPEDETDWDTASGDAIGLRAGYGDGMSVNGLAVMGQDLIVSKAGAGKRFLYRVNVSGASTGWLVQKLISDTSASGPLLISAVPNNVLYINESAELRGIAGVQEYGDIQAMNVGERINPRLVAWNDNALSPSMLRYLPSYDILAIMFSGYCFAYHPATKRFTSFDGIEAGITVLSCCDYNNVPYFGSKSGLIYRWDTTRSKDEPEQEVDVAFSSKVTSKKFYLPGDAIIKRTDIALTSIAEGAGVVEAVGPNSTVVLAELTLAASGEFLYAATGDLYDATGYLNTGGAEGSFTTSRRRTRKSRFYLQIRTTSGRVGVNSLDTQLALVNG